MSWFDLADEVKPALRAGDLESCIERVVGALSDLPKSPFHIVREVDFENDPSQIAAHFEKFISKQTRYELAAIYTETNGFDINPHRWFFDVFGYRSYGGHKDYDWVSDWQSGHFKDMTLVGMESLQSVYDSDAFRAKESRKAADIASLLVVLKFQALIQRSAGLIPNLAVPLLATSHDYDFIYEYTPSGDLPSTPARSSRGVRGLLGRLLGGN